MNYLSLFTGIGGFELGIQDAYRGQNRGSQSNQAESEGQGLCSEKGQDSDSSERLSGSGIADQSNERPQCIGYSEIDKYAVQTYEKNLGGTRNYGDITTIKPEELPDFNLVVGGFPCQTFSIAGKRKGFEDTRGTLFFDIARILDYKRPGHFVLENVKGLLNHDGGKTFQTILTVLTDLGYVVEWQLLNSKHFGVPQNRERVYIVGHLGNKCGRKVFPIRPNSSDHNLSNVIGATLTSRYPASQREGTYIEEERSNRSASVKVKEATKAGFAIATEGDSINFSQPKSKTRRGRVGKGIANTLETSLTQGTLDGIRVRKLTPIECERLQGFPDNWTAGVSDTQRYKQAGNAVTVNTVSAVIQRLIPCLESA